MRNYFEKIPPMYSLRGYSSTGSIVGSVCSFENVLEVEVQEVTTDYKVIMVRINDAFIQLNVHHYSIEKINKEGGDTDAS